MRLDKSARITHLCNLAHARIATGDLDAGRTYLRAARAESGDVPAPEILRLLGDLTSQLEGFAEGVQLMEQALDGFRLAEDRAGEVVTMGDLAALLQRSGQLGRARMLIDRALAHVDPVDREQRARLLNIAATIASFQGRLDDALALLAEAEPLAGGRLRGWIALNSAAALANLARHDTAQATLARAVDHLMVEDGYTPLMLDYARAWLAIGWDDLATAHTICQEVMRRMAPDQHSIIYHPLLATLGLLAREAGDLESAESLLCQALLPLRVRNDRATMLGIGWHRALVALARGALREAADQLRNVMLAMQADGYGTTLLWQPRRFAELCDWAITQGVEATFAAWLLESSLAPWATPIEGRHRASAAPHTEAILAAVESSVELTKREVEILMLAAQGLRDREIATRLHMSVRTVQNHLHRCYAKLGVPNRAAAVRWMLDAQAVNA